MADQTNPFTMAGMMGMMMPNKYIDPAYKDKALPLPGFYGAPTDAQGNPIQSFTDAQNAHDAWAAAHPAQGTTLTSTPDAGLEAKGSQARAMQDAGYGNWAMLDPMMAHSSIPGQTGGSESIGATRGWNPANPATATGAGGAGGLTPMGGSTQQSGGAAQQNPIDMRQAYLTALSNPGHVTTPGASVPQAQPLGTPSVMDSFMAAHPGGGGAGAGNYSNTGFFDTLNKLRAS